MSIRALIIDDERLARLRIIKLLEPFSEVQIIGECKNGTEAIESIQSQKPDLIFLDIQMPDYTGFEVLTKVDLSFNPVIIFATAYDDYALKAFDVHAVDYLLKPFDSERFNIALERAKQYLLMRKSSEFNDKIKMLMKEFYNFDNNYKAKFEIKFNGKKTEIYAEEIYYFEADGNYVNIITDGKKILYRATMNNLEEELDHSVFLRIHRSIIVNAKCVKSVRYFGENNKYKFILNNGDEVLSGRSYKEKIMNFLSANPII